MASQALSHSSSSVRIPSFVEEARCGKLGFTIINVNLIAVAIFAGNLALGGALVGALSFASAAVILPSIVLFGPLNYFYSLPQPLLMGIGFAAAWASVKVGANGAWQGKWAHLAHFNDHRLAEGLKSWFKDLKIESAIDCGCGTGFYVNQLRTGGMNKVYGCDANLDTPRLGGEACFVADLSQPHFLQHTQHQGDKFDCVMSFEVAEHLPKKYEANFLDNLVSAAKQQDGWIILSWAKKGQGGLGHVNEQDESYVIAQMENRGCIYQPLSTERLRLSTSPHTFWFRETLYVFYVDKQ